MKQIYNVIKTVILLFALLGVSGNVWGTDCTYNISASDWSDSRKNFDVTICTVASQSPHTAVKISFKITLTKVALGKSLTYDLYAVASDNSRQRIATGLTVSNGGSSSPNVSFTTTKNITSFALDQTSGNFGQNRNVSITGITITYQYAASLSADDVTMDDTPKGGSSTKTITVTYQNSTTSATISASEQSDANGFFSISPASHSVSDCSGSVDFTVTFAPTAPAEGATATYRFSGNGTTKDVTVTGTAFNVVDPTFTNTFESFYYVDASALNLAELWTSNNTAGNITYSVVKYDETGTNNEAGVDPYIDGHMLYLGKAGDVTIKMHQETSTGYNAKDATLKITIKKRPNTLSCNWESWTKTLNFNEGIYTIFSSDNELIDLSPINVTQTSGEKNATYYPDTINYIFASVNDNTDATWDVSQDEDYKYEAAVTKTFSVHVCEASAPEDCKVILYKGYSSKSEKVSDIPPIDLGGVGEKLSLHITTNGYYGNDAKLYTHTASTDWKYLQDVSAPEGGERDLNDIDLPEGTTHIKFEQKGLDNPYIMSIVVTKPRYFNIQNASKANISSLTMPQNTPGGKIKTEKFYIDYSTCDDTIRLNSTNSQITFTASGTTTYKFAVDKKHYGRQEIELTYTSGTTAEVISSVVTAYTQYDNAAITVNAETVGKLATHINYIGNASYPSDTTNIAAANLFEVRDVNNALVPGATITLCTKNASIADVVSNAVDPICSGDVTITASYVGDDTYEKSDKEQSINIHKVDDEVYIEGRSVIVIGDDIDLSTWCSSLSGTTLSYRVLHSSVLAIENGHLIAKGKGKDTLIVTTAGNCVYNPGVDSLFIKVRKATDPCETLLLDETTKLNLGMYGYSKDIPKIIEIPNYDRPKDILTYKTWKYNSITTQDVHFEIYNSSNTLIWDTVHYSTALGTSAREIKVSMKNLQDAAYLKIYANSDGLIGVGGTFYKYVDDIQLTQKCYFTAESLTPSTMPTVTACDTAKAQFELKYSDVGPIYLTHDAGDLLTYEVWKDGVKLNDFDNDCGDWGVYTIKLFYVPLTAGDYSHTVTLSASGKSQTVTISGTATAAKREIEWNVPAKNTITATQSANILTAFAKTDCVNPAGEVAYTISPASAVTVSGTTVTFNQPIDKLTITANTTSSELYGAADAVTKEWKVNQIGVTMQTLPTITSDIYCGNSASDVTYAEDWLAVNTLNGGAVAGSISYNSPASFSAVGATDLTFTFTPDDDLYETIQFVVPIEVLAVPVYTFTGKGEWETTEYWLDSKKPAADAVVDVKVTGELVITDSYEVTSLTIDGGSVTIAPNGGFTVGAGGITGADQTNLILKAGTEGDIKGQTGYLRISPEYTGSMPEATVELFSGAYYDMKADNRNDVGTWQFVGSPLANNVAAKAIFTESFIYEWDTLKGDWVNNRKKGTLKPFMGYSTSQYMNPDGLKVIYAGELVSNMKPQDIKLYYSEGEEVCHNMVANSYTAPIDITKFDLDDFDNVEGAIYLFNTGSRNDIANLENDAKRGETFSAPGQYIHIPIVKVKEMKAAFPDNMPTSIAPMQGFCVHATGENPKITLDYSKLVWNGDYKDNGNGPLRVIARDENKPESVRSLCVTLLGGGLVDNLYMLESEENNPSYENGSDARKMMSGALNIFSVAGADQLAVDATDSFIGTHLGIRSGEETTYTMIFSHLRSDNKLALLDNETNERIDINEGTEYTFYAEPNSDILTRFQIVERANAPAITTDVENVTNGENVHKFIKDNQLYILKNGVIYNAQGKVVR